MNCKTVAVVLLFAASAFGQQASDQHHSGVVQRGDHVMGFSHEKTMHHFRLTEDGGSIEAIANNSADANTRQQIREHLQHIAVMFSEGDFNAPMLIHARSPPGVLTMMKLRHGIQYHVEDLRDGARVRVSSQNPKAIAAIHDFLRFQIQDHRTGDSEVIAKE
ncbi:MAG: hypothetical protein ACJ71Q_18380 [Terriglobales bacterium]